MVSNEVQVMICKLTMDACLLVWLCIYVVESGGQDQPSHAGSLIMLDDFSCPHNKFHIFSHIYFVICKYNAFNLDQSKTLSLYRVDFQSQDKLNCPHNKFHIFSRIYFVICKYNAFDFNQSKTLSL